jgi:hypothetical protein
MVKLSWVTLSGEKYEDFSKWFIVMGDLTRRKKIFQVVKNTKIFQSGFIVISDLSR